MNSRTVSLLFFALYLPFSFYVKSLVQKNEGFLASFPVGSKVESFSLPDISGTQTELSTLTSGKQVTIINFWATWCGPCRAEMPELIEMYNLHKDKGLQVVGVNVDEDEEVLDNFLKEHPLPFPILKDSHSRLLRKYRIQGIPATVVVDDHSRVIESYSGAPEYLRFRVLGWLKPSSK